MSDNKNAGDRIEVLCFTDPLCCWSAALQPHLEKLKNEFPGNIHIRYCMSAMIADWNTYNDPLFSVQKPIQMGPVWMEARHTTGADIHDHIWVSDPPSSSFPACLAVKTAEIQSSQAADQMLFALREAVMKKGLNIAKESVISAVAEELAALMPGEFDLERFKREYNQSECRNLLRQDLKEVKLHQVGRFPTLIVRKKGYQSVMLTGYRPYETLVSAFEYLKE